MRAVPLEHGSREAPDDVGAWRSYADVLLERKDARGRLIKLELRLARGVRGAEREALRREIDQVTKEHREGWDAELPEGVRAVTRRYGFATKVAVDWSQEAPEQIAEALRGPLVSGLRIQPGSEAEESDAEYWEDPTDYDGDGQPLPPPPHDVGALADIDFGGLRELDLGYFRIGAPGARVVAASASVGGVETLDLRYCDIGDEGAAALAASGNVHGVRRLRVQSNRLTADGVRALARLERIEELDLRYNRIGVKGAQALVEAPFVGSLRRLLLYRQDVSDAGVALLASAPHLPSALRSYWKSV